jgi:hypothetical protein
LGRQQEASAILIHQINRNERKRDATGSESLKINMSEDASAVNRRRRIQLRERHPHRPRRVVCLFADGKIRRLCQQWPEGNLDARSDRVGINGLNQRRVERETDIGAVEVDAISDQNVHTDH